MLSLIKEGHYALLTGGKYIRQGFMQIFKVARSH